jgi:hypothetical protein
MQRSFSAWSSKRREHFGNETRTTKDTKSTNVREILILRFIVLVFQKRDENMIVVLGAVFASLRKKSSFVAFVLFVVSN